MSILEIILYSIIGILCCCYLFSKIFGKKKDKAPKKDNATDND